LSGATLTPFTTGLINASWLVTTASGEQRVLQALNPIFPPAINRDIDIVTRHLESKNLMTPRLLARADGALWLEAEHAVWRQLTYVPGDTFERLENPERVRSAAALLARFHATLADLEHEFANARLGVHDLARHLDALRTALATHTQHRDYAAVAVLAAPILELAATLSPLPPTGDRIVHGDPKISNVVFDTSTGAALCLIDLDTLARMPLPLELGDALRSWCNPAGEDDAAAALRLPLYRAAVEGYAAHAKDFIAAAEWQAIPNATLQITIELAARFCADALNERYFGWDPTRYASASAHNQARARSQLHLADSISSQLDRLDTETARAFSG
jgi:Ser/Thr protein kinase RdoA (MazF antagonist)